MVTSNAIKGCVLSRKKWRLAIRTWVFYFEKWLIWGRGDGALVRALTFHHCGLGSILGPGVKCGLSFFLVLVLAPRVFLWVLWFFFLHKNQHFKFQFDLETVDRKSHLMDRELPKLLLLSSSSLLLSVSYLVLFVLFPATQQFIGQRLLRIRWIQLGSHLLSMPEHFAMEIMIGKYNVLWLFIQSNLDYPDLLIIWTCFSGPIFQ